MKDAKNLLVPSTPNSKEYSSLLYCSLEGLKRFNLIITAYDAGLFELSATPKTAQTLAAELGSSNEIMVQLFCDALVEVGLLTKSNGEYVNSPLTATYLCKDSPHYMQYSLQNMKSNADRWALLPSILKNGPIMQKRDGFFGSNWLYSIAEGAEAGSVANTLNVVTAHVDPKRWCRLLDLGGGHGLYAIGFTALNPKLDAYVFDLPKAIPITQEYIKAYNADNVHVIPGDFNKDNIGQEYDAVFSSFNQSCFDPAFIPKIVQALAPNGDVILRRFKESTRTGALATLDWNLHGFEGKKIGSKPHSSDSIVDRETYLNHLAASGLEVLGTFTVDEISEITFARKPKIEVDSTKCNATS
jgi:precorrin-6B methylase 2